MGGRSLSVLDNEKREVFRIAPLEPYFNNFYDCLGQMMLWLGVAKGLPARNQIFQEDAQQHEVTADFRIAVSPFTSKEDPSERYWSQLLTQMLPAEISRRVRIVIDTGASPESEAFATALSRSTRMSSHPNVLCRVAQCHTSRNVSLADIVCCFRDADMVITADSFPAHAAPLFGRLTFVIARAGAKNWRVPCPTNFYLPAEATAAEIAGTIRMLLREYAADTRTTSMFTPRESRECRSLRESSSNLGRALGSGASWEDLQDLWELFSNGYADVLKVIHSWPEQYSVLLSDHNYQSLWAPFPNRDTPQSRNHVASRFNDWLNSNLQKYLLLEPNGRTKAG